MDNDEIIYSGIVLGMVDQITFKRMFGDFSPAEFECPCKGPTCQVDGMNFNFLFALQELRRQFARPITINSGYRCAAYNATLKDSVRNSTHILGIACDISTHAMPSSYKHILLERIFASRFTGVGIYKNFIHIDIRPASKRSMWVG